MGTPSSPPVHLKNVQKACCKGGKIQSSTAYEELGGLDWSAANTVGSRCAASFARIVMCALLWILPGTLQCMQYIVYAGARYCRRIWSSTRWEQYGQVPTC